MRPAAFDVCFPNGPNLAWQVVGLRGTEAISQPYEFDVQLFTEAPSLDTDEILGLDCELLVERDGLTRSIFGVIAEVESLTDAEVGRERAGTNLRIRIVPAFHLLDHESLQSFDWRSCRTPNRVVARGYNMKLPSSTAQSRAERIDARRPIVREIFIDGALRQIIDDPIDDAEARSFTGAALDQRGRQAARVLQRHTLESELGRGRSNAIGFTAGRVFRSGDHPNPALAQREFLLVRVTHEAEEMGDSEPPSHTYLNRFECIPFDRPFRPALRTPRPRVHGVQTGVVVGRTPNEVYTDQFGRVRVKFHRDRHGADDEHASCWIRVAQIWAGAGYGATVIPRVGMEVVVSFVDGNPTVRS